MSAPIVGAELFRTVLDACGGRCVCEGVCGQQHAKSESRCPRVHDAYAGARPVRLMVAAADPALTDLAAASLPADGLRAWCPSCFTAARRIARRAHVPPVVAEQGGLFDL